MASRVANNAPCIESGRVRCLPEVTRARITPWTVLLLPKHYVSTVHLALTGECNCKSFLCTVLGHTTKSAQSW